MAEILILMSGYQLVDMWSVCRVRYFAPAGFSGARFPGRSGYRSLRLSVAPAIGRPGELTNGLFVAPASQFFEFGDHLLCHDCSERHLALPVDDLEGRNPFDPVERRYVGLLPLLQLGNLMVTQTVVFDGSGPFVLVVIE